MIYIADSKWLPTMKNPFSSDGLYSNMWSAFIYDDSISHCTNIYENAKLYTIRFSVKDDMDNIRLFDFLSYEISYGRNVIFKTCAGFNAKDILAQYSKADKKISFRNTDYPYMVHSTTLSSWESIQKDNAVISPNMLKAQGRPIAQIGLKALLEPDDYSDYVMLDKPDGCGEIVVNSRQLGHVCLETNCVYRPGVRLYFDVKKIIKDEIAIRDGLHILKVKDRLPLTRYLVAAITAQNFSSDIKWTPTQFTETANKLFYEKYVK